MSAISAEHFPGRFRLRHAKTGRSIDVEAGDVEALSHRIRVAVGDREIDPFWLLDGRVTEGARVLLTVEPLRRPAS